MRANRIVTPEKAPESVRIRIAAVLPRRSLTLLAQSQLADYPRQRKHNSQDGFDIYFLLSYYRPAASWGV
jgi:hypothetical protein